MERKRKSGWLVTCLLIASSAMGGPGDLDVRWGSHGLVELPGIEYPVAVMPLDDGGALVVGYGGFVPDEFSGSMSPFVPAEARMLRIDAQGVLVSSRLLFPGRIMGAIRLHDGRVLLASMRGGGDVTLERYFADGTLDTSYAEAGKRRLTRAMLATGSGISGGDFYWPTFGFAELAGGDVIVSTIVTSGHVNSGFDPAVQGVVFRIGQNGQLLHTARPAAPLLSERIPESVFPLSDGRFLLLALAGCCDPKGGLILTLDNNGNFAPVPPGGDGQLSFSGLALNPATERFVAVSLVRRDWHIAHESIVVAGTPNDGLDPAFGGIQGGLLRITPPNARGIGASSLLNLGNGDVLVMNSLTSHYNDFRDEVGSEVQLVRLRPDGSIVPAMDGSRAIPLADPFPHLGRGLFGPKLTVEGNALALLSRLNSYGPRPGNPALAKLQLSPGPGSGSLGFEVARVRIAEGGATRSVRIIRSGGAEGAVSLRYGIEPITATPGDVALLDGVLLWPDGDATSREIFLGATNDGSLEGEETFRVRLSQPLGGAVVVAGDPLHVTIEDDEALRAISVSQVAGQIRPGQKAEFRITLNQRAPGPVSLIAMLSDGIDKDGWPVDLGLSNSGVGRTWLEWPAQDIGVRAFDWGTNSNSDPKPDVTLTVRLRGVDGLVLDAAGKPTGASVVIASGASSTASGSAHEPSGGGGALRPWTLTALLAMFLPLVRRRWSGSARTGRC